MALYMSILEDAKDRVAQQKLVEETPDISKKRKRRHPEGIWFGSRKRRRTGGKKSIARRESRVDLFSLDGMQLLTEGTDIS